MDPTTWDLPFPIVVAALFVIVMGRANGTYWLGRAAAAGTARTRAGRLMQASGYLRAVRVLHRWGPPAVSASFLTIGFQTLINLAAGTTRMPLRRYLPAVTVGSVLWGFLYATVGFASVEAIQLLYATSPVLAIVAAATVAAALATYIVMTLRKTLGPADEADSEHRSLIDDGQVDRPVIGWHAEPAAPERD